MGDDTIGGQKDIKYFKIQTLGMVRFKFNFNDLTFQRKRNFIFRVERRSMNLLFKILNSFNGVIFELSDGTTQDRSFR